MGVLNRQLVSSLCRYHKITQKLANPEYFGSDQITPQGVQATFNAAARYCETRKEVLMTLCCLLAFGRGMLSKSKFEKLQEFVDDATATLSTWALCMVILVLSMGLSTTSSLSLCGSSIEE